MRPTRNLVLLSLLAASVVLAAGCAPQPNEPESADVDVNVNPPATDGEMGDETGMADVDAGTDVGAIEAEMWLDEPTLGTQVDLDGSVPDEAVADDFEAGDQVYLSLKVDDAPAGSEVKVIWYGPTEELIAEESKAVRPEEGYVYFEAGDTSAWRAGEYSVTAWVGDERVLEKDFQVVQQVADVS